MRSLRRAVSALTVTVAVLAGAGLSALPARASVATCPSVGLTVTALHGPRFYIDTGVTPNLTGAYAGYKLTNTGSARSDLWVRLSGFTGGVVGLGSGQAASQQIASLAGSGSTALFWYLTATTDSATAQDHDVQVWQGRPDLPGATQLCGTTGGFTSVDQTIQANSSSLDSVSVSGGTPRIGATFTVTATGSTGTIGNGTSDDPQSFWMSPAASAAWPANAYRLVGTSLTLGATTYTDILRVANVGSTNRSYTATYTFRAIGYTASGTSVLPVQQIASGTQIKHTPTSPSSGSLPAITPATNDLTLAKAADTADLAFGGGTVHYTVTVSGSAGPVVDSFEDTVPSGATYVPGSATWRGSAVSTDPVLSSGVLTFPGPFTVGPANGSTLEYDLVLPPTAGDRSNSVVATVGSATLDTTAGLGDSAPPTATVHVDAAPTATADSADVTEGVAADLDVLANDTDPEGDTLTVTAVTAAGHGTASVVGGTVRYTATPGYTGADSFTYTVSDGRGGEATGTVTVTVHAAAALVAADDTVTATSGEALDIDVLANDTGNAPLVVDAVGTAAHGTVSIVAGTVRYTPDAAWTGPDSFTYTVSDALAYTATATVAVTVDPPALVAGADTATTDDGTPTTVSPLGNDSGFGTLGATLLAQPTHGTVTDNGDGTFGFAPEAGWQGTTTFTYTLTDGLGRTATGTVGVTVGPRAAAAADDAAATDDASPVTVSPLGNDDGFGTLAVDAFTQPPHGTVTDNGDGTLGFAPEAGWQGSATFTYTLADSAGQHDDGTVTVTVTPRALSATDDTAATDDATAVDVDVLGDDSGFGTLAVDAFTQPAHGTVSDNGDGTLRFAPQAGEQGTETFGYTVTDSAGQNGSGTVTVTVAPRALVPGDDSVSTDTSPATVDLLGNDDGFGTLAVTGLTQPAHGTVTDNGDGTAGFTPEPGWSGTTTFTYTVTDAAGQTATGTVTVTVGPAAPPAPTAADDTASTDDASGVVVHVLDNDSGTGSLTVTSFTQPDHGTVTDNGDGTLTLTPEEGWTGTAVFTYTVTDSGGGTAVGTVEVAVGPRLLVATDDTGSTDDATATTVDVLANDTGFGTLTVDAFTQPAHGTVTDEGGGTLGFAPEAGWTGTASFTYDVSDAAGGTGTATVDVTVTGSGDGGGGGDGGAGDPVDDDASVAHDGDALVDVLANDPDGATLDAVGTDPEHGTAVVEEGGIRYTPDGTFAGTDSFTYTVAGSGTAATVTVEVTAPDLETADDEATAAHGGVPVTVDVLGNDTGSGLTVTEVSEPAPGGAATVEDGAVVLTPADGFRGDVTFTYTVTDVVGSTATATVTVTVPNARPTVSPVPGRTLVAGTATTFTLTVADADPDDDPAVTAGVPTGSAGAGGAVRPVVGRTAGGAPTVRLTVAATFSGTVAVPVAVSDGHSGGTATTVLRLVVSPVAAAGVGFGVVPNPDGRAAVGRPEFDRWGWPVARQLSTRIDSRITWRVSGTTSVSRYDVRVDGAVVCTVPAALLAATQSCTLPRQALRGTEVVTVTAAGAAGTSTASRVPPTTAGATSGHLLAVVYFPAGRFALDRTAQKVLRRADALADVYGLDGLRLVGHTDWDGTPESNQRLSERRAAQVAAWMTGASARVLLSTAGRGESEPAVSNRTYSGKAANRRVEIWVG